MSVDGSDPALREVPLRGGADVLAVEEPLEIRLDGRPLAVLMRSPGEDLDLVAGFLATEGVIDGLDDLTALGHCTDPARPARRNVVLANLAAGVSRREERFERARRELHAVSGCGLCGKASIDRIFQTVPPLAERQPLEEAFVLAAPERLRALQPRFDATGGVHGAALMDRSGALLLAREDVGRHNAVDKVIGARLRAERYPLEGAVLVVSSRAGFEIVQKALVARVSALIAVGAASTLAAELAVRGHLALYTFVREGRYRAL